MLFNSIPFILAFMPLTTILYFVARRHIGYESALLLLTIASVIFYAYWDVTQTWRIFASMVGNFAFGNWLQRLSVDNPHRKSVLVLGISLNVLALVYFKYTNFIIANIAGVFGLDFHVADIILPLGISFFTFNEIAYLVDSYRGKTREYKFSHYCLFVTFYPHLIAGPIIHHKQLMGEFLRKNRFRSSDISVGLTIFIIGLSKKVLIADNIAVYSTPAFDAAANGVTLSFFEAWAAALGYTFQLYFDFSGYSDMAIGLSRLYGIQLPVNFYSPYKARSIIDFWRRWHISLSAFLRDYVYVPLGGGHRRRYTNLMATMLIGGIWHGANWTFLVWGGLHGIFLIINHGWIRCKSAAPILSQLTAGTVGQVFATAMTFTAVVVAWVFFRAANLDVAYRMIASMGGLNGVSLPISMSSIISEVFPPLMQLGAIQFGGMFPNNISEWQHEGVFWLLGAAAICHLLPNTSEFMSRYRPGIMIYPSSYNYCSWPSVKWKPTFFFGSIASTVSIVVLLFLLSPNNSSEFLYFQF
jgi:alginate O-acetyltransferase complex protein AlgI